MKLLPLALSASLALVAAAAYAPTAQAGTALTSANAVAFCQSSLPTSDVNIRKSPLFVANQGTTSSFVTCSFPVSDDGTGFVDVYLYNTTGSDIDVDCTMVDGAHWAVGIPGLPAYYPLTTTIPAGTSATAAWDASVLGVTFSNINNVNCLMPPGIQMLLVGSSPAGP